MEVCRDEMICDLAETYHVLNYMELSPELVAVLLIGLRDDSRVKMKLAKAKMPLERLLLARLTDAATFLAWAKTEAAQKNQNRPESIVRILLNDVEEKQCEGCDSPDDFKAKWRESCGD